MGRALLRTGRGCKMKDIMTKDVVTVHEGEPVKEAVGKLLNHCVDGLPVVDDEGRLVGIFGKKEVYRLVQECGTTAPVSEFMHRGVVTVKAETCAERGWPAEVGRLPVIDENGALVGIVTRTDMARFSWERNEELGRCLKAVLDCSASGVVVIDARGRITLVNPVAERILGVREQDVLRKPLREVWPENSLDDVLLTGRPRFGERLLLFNQGKTIISNQSPVVVDGEVVGGVAVFHDISDLENVSQELRELRETYELLNAVIDISADGLVICDGTGRILTMNKAYARMIGAEAESFKGKNVRELVESGYMSEAVTMHTLDTKCPACVIQLINGREVVCSATPLVDKEGQVVRVIANMRDLTELNRIKEELQSSRKLLEEYQAEVERLRQNEVGREIVFRSAAMREVVDMALKVARVDSTVLITGESGVGKENVAKVIHRVSSRSAGPLVKINCGAVSPNLIESELFGYEEGAFTGARKGGKQGLFEAAAGGTILLDEIGELPIEMQVKLLRVLQDREVVRVGGCTPIPIDVRVIAATNRDLEALVAEGKFREDLFYRLNVLRIVIPPLRERKEDIVPLLAHFLNEFNRKYGTDKRFSEELAEAFVSYSWPGNVRELQNMVERLVILSPGTDLDVDLFWKSIKRNGEASSPRVPPLKERLEEMEKRIIIETYCRYRSTRRAAKVLGVNQSTVVRKLQKYGYRVSDMEEQSGAV